VVEAFELRRDGLAQTEIARRLGWSHSTTRQILVNEVYLGVIRHGAFRKEGAHEPLVSRELFDAVQASRTPEAIPAGESTRGRLLIGLARCGGCGRTLKVVRRPRADGSYVVAYYCKNAAADPCPSRAYVHADELDALLEDWFSTEIRKVRRQVDVLAVGRELERAQSKLAAAERELAAYVENASALDAVLFQRGLSARQGKVDEAREAVQHLASRSSRLPAGGSLASLWGSFDALQRRAVLAGFIDRIEVDRGASADLSGHVRIVLSDGSLAVPDVADDESGVGVLAA
jgi:hypothetical protein